MGVPQIAGWFISWKILPKWMIWGCPHLRKPPYAKQVKLLVLIYVANKRNLASSVFFSSTLWLFNIAMENGPFIDGLPIINGDFPVRYVTNNQMVHCFLNKPTVLRMTSVPPSPNMFDDPRFHRRCTRCSFP